MGDRDGAAGASGCGAGHLEGFLGRPSLVPACRRLERLGAEWALARGTAWDEVLNSGPLPPGGPSWAFRWRVVAQALEWSAGLGPPPGDWSALPLGLQAFLSWALPAAVRPARPPSLDAAAANRLLAEAERLAADLGAGAEAPAAALPAVALPPREGGDPAALLAAALRQPAPAPAVPGLAELRAALAAGPMALGTLRDMADRHGVLPGTLLDALDREARRETGRAAARVEGGWLVPEGRDGGTQGLG